MESRELKAAIKPEAARLKALGKGVRVREVLGPRVLIRTIEPWTEMDEVEKSGLLKLPEWVKRANMPLPQMGIVVQLGEEARSRVEERTLSVGGYVMFSKFAGIDFKVQMEDFRICMLDEIIATFEVDDPTVFIKDAV